MKKLSKATLKELQEAWENIEFIVNSHMATQDEFKDARKTQLEIEVEIEKRFPAL